MVTLLRMLLLAGVGGILFLTLCNRGAAWASFTRSVSSLPGGGIALLAACGLLALAFASRSTLPLVLLAIGAIGLTMVAWVREFTALMAQPDTSFPGRYDKAIWALLMIALPPVGLIVLGQYRRSVESREKPARSMEWM